MDEWLKRRFEEMAQLDQPADDSSPQHRSAILERKAGDFMKRLIARAERQVAQFNEEHAGRMELQFARRGELGFSVVRSNDGFRVSYELDASRERIRVGLDRQVTAGQATETTEFDLALDIDSDDRVIINRTGRSLRRMGRREWCLWLLSGTVFWPGCFWWYRE